MWELDDKESWALKNWCFWTVLLEKTLERPLDCTEIQPVHPKGNQSWILTGRTDAEAEAETAVLWPPDVKNWLIAKEPDVEKDWRQEEKGTTEDEMVGWHHWLNGHEFEQVLGDGEGQRSLACYSLWGCNESDTTDWLNSKNKLFSLCLSILSPDNNGSCGKQYSNDGDVQHIWKQLLSSDTFLGEAISTDS